MQQLLEESSPTLYKVIPFPMPRPSKCAPTPVPARAKAWKEHWGTYAQWAAFCGMVVLFLITQYCAHSSEDFGLRVDKRIDDKLAPGNAKLDDLIQRMSSVEGEIKVLLAQKSIVASGKYAAQGKMSLAVEAAQMAADTFATASAKKLPAPPEYFVDTIEIINQVKPAPSSDLSEKLHDVRLSLANYRSALLTVQITYTQKFTFKSVEHAFVIYGGSGIDGGYFDASNVPGNFIQIASQQSEAAYVKNATIKGGSQTLDGIHWSNVTFVGVHIKYLGGRVSLNNVTFVGCTFEAPNTDAGTKFTDYAALQLPKLTIG